MRNNNYVVWLECQVMVLKGQHWNPVLDIVISKILPLALPWDSEIRKTAADRIIMMGEAHLFCKLLFTLFKVISYTAQMAEIKIKA